VPALVPGGGAVVDLQNLAVRIENQELEINATLVRALPEGTSVNLYAFGYRPDRPFGSMPKLALRIGVETLTIRDQDRILPRTTAEARVTGAKLTARIPLAALGDPDRLFLHAETRLRDTSLNQTPWWVLELPAAAEPPAPGCPAPR